MTEDAALGLQLLKISQNYRPISVHPTDPALSTYTEDDLRKMSHELSQEISGKNIKPLRIEGEVGDLLEEVIEIAGKSVVEGGGKHKKKKQKHQRTHKHARNINNNFENDTMILKSMKPTLPVRRLEPEATANAVAEDLLLPGEMVAALETVGRPDEPVASLSCLYRAYLSVKRTTHAAWSVVSRPPSESSILTTLKSTSSILGTVCVGAAYIPPLEPYATPLAAFFGIATAGLATANVTVRAVNHGRGVHPVSTANAIRIGTDALSYTIPYAPGLSGAPGTVLSHTVAGPAYLEMGRQGAKALNFSELGAFSLNNEVRAVAPHDPTVYNRMATFLTKGPK